MAPFNGMFHHNLLLTVQCYFSQNHKPSAKNHKLKHSLQLTYHSKVVERKWQYIYQDLLYILQIKIQ